VPFCGPTFAGKQTRGSELIVRFEHVDGGVVAKGAVEGFEIAGANGKFVPAKGRIDGETVVLSADGVDSPVDVRYGWANDPKCTLFNKAGFPAEPFSTK